eukprot:2158969-Prymnesium_polylepis.2
MRFATTAGGRSRISVDLGRPRIIEICSLRRRLRPCRGTPCWARCRLAAAPRARASPCPRYSSDPGHPTAGRPRAMACPCPAASAAVASAAASGWASCPCRASRPLACLERRRLSDENAAAP